MYSLSVRNGAFPYCAIRLFFWIYKLSHLCVSYRHVFYCFYTNLTTRRSASFFSIHPLSEKIIGGYECTCQPHLLPLSHVLICVENVVNGQSCPVLNLSSHVLLDHSRLIPPPPSTVPCNSSFRCSASGDVALPEELPVLLVDELVVVGLSCNVVFHIFNCLVLCVCGLQDLPTTLPFK